MTSKLHRAKSRLVGSSLLSVVLLFAGLTRLSLAQQSATPNVDSTDNLQRSAQLEQYAELAQSGPLHGETIYSYKCFYCHNQYAKGGPPLENLFKHPQLSSGAAPNDQTVAAVIKNGSAKMPGFGYALNDGDIQDLISYLRSRQCCYQGDDPPVNPAYRAVSQKWSVPSTSRGGPHGLVRARSGETLEGMRVQLVAPNAVRTTVFTDVEGKYEFPAMQAGAYTLRIATPLSFKPYRRDAVQINAANVIDEIVLDKVPKPGAEHTLPGTLPATPEILAQLSGAEMLWNLPGTALEKSTFAKTCAIGCHDLKQIFRNRFDERGWRFMVNWMNGFVGSVFVNPKVGGSSIPLEEQEMVIKWLARVRGPESKDLPYRVFPRPSGPSTRVVITEYEVPRRFLDLHEVVGDSKGNMWYSSHHSPYVGVLDPRTGIVKEYKIPLTPGMFPGTYRVNVDKNDIPWFSENWAHNLTSLNPVTGKFKQVRVESEAPFNGGVAIGNFGLAPDGYVWNDHGAHEIAKIDPNTGKIVKTYPLTRNPTSASENAVSADGRFWGGGGGGPAAMEGTGGSILDIRSGQMYEANSGDRPSSGARGAFDFDDNVWFGGDTGLLVEVVNEIDQGKGIHLRTFLPPTPYFPYSQFYAAVPDKNGDVWAGLVHGRGFVRLTPKTEQWRVYDNPEPGAFGRHAWVDNSTNPVAVWYPDYQMGTLVRIQPLD